MDLVLLPVVGTYVSYRPRPRGHRYTPTEEEICGTTAGDLARGLNLTLQKGPQIGPLLGPQIRPQI